MKVSRITSPPLLDSPETPPAASANDLLTSLDDDADEEDEDDDKDEDAEDDEDDDDVCDVSTPPPRPPPAKLLRNTNRRRKSGNTRHNRPNAVSVAGFLPSGDVVLGDDGEDEEGGRVHPAVVMVAPGGFIDRNSVLIKDLLPSRRARDKTASEPVVQVRQS